MEKVGLPQPVSAGLLLSYQCNPECRYCMYCCSFKWKGWISEADLKSLCSKLAGRIRPSPYGEGNVSLNHGLHFTGGEPFLNFDLLLKAVQIAQQLNIPSTFVETNCHWCTDDSVTSQRLQTLKESGLKGILISVNPFYLEYVPFERTERCIRIAHELFDQNVMVYQLEYYSRFRKLGIKGRISVEDYLISARDNLTSNVELFLMGRAAYKLRQLYPRYPPNYFLRRPCQPPFLRNWHNHFDNYGNYLPSYCGGISLGNWRGLDHLLDDGLELDDKPILGFLVKQDFAGLLRFAKDFGYREFGEGYISKCHLCVEIRRYMKTKQQFNELKPKEFYSYLE